MELIFITLEANVFAQIRMLEEQGPQTAMQQLELFQQAALKHQMEVYANVILHIMLPLLVEFVILSVIQVRPALFAICIQFQKDCQ